MPSKRIGKRQAKKLLGQMFDQVSATGGRAKANELLLGSGELAQMLTQGGVDVGGSTGGKGKTKKAGKIARDILSFGLGDASGSGADVGEVVGSTGGKGKTKKAGKIARDILSFGLGDASGGLSQRNSRGAVVAQVMKDKGMKLGEASRYVKEHNLWA